MGDNWEDKLYKERDDLREKLEKLRKFINESEEYTKLPSFERHLLTKQQNLMWQLLETLNQRITALEKGGM